MFPFTSEVVTGLPENNQTNSDDEVNKLNKNLESLQACIVRQRELGLIGSLDDAEDSTCWKTGSDRVFSSRLEDELQSIRKSIDDYLLQKDHTISENPLSSLSRLFPFLSPSRMAQKKIDDIHNLLENTVSRRAPYKKIYELSLYTRLRSLTANIPAVMKDKPMLPDRVFEQIHLRHTSLEKMAIRLTSMLEMAEPLTQAMFKDIRDLTKEYFHLADRALKLDELYPCADESLLRVVRYCELSCKVMDSDSLIKHSSLIVFNMTHLKLSSSLEPAKNWIQVCSRKLSSLERAFQILADEGWPWGLEETKEEQAHRERLEKRMCDELAMWKHTQQPTLLEALAYSKVDPDAKQSKAYLNDLAGNLQISTSSKALTSIIGVRRICQGPPPRANRVGESIRGGFSLVHCVYLSGPMQYICDHLSKEHGEFKVAVKCLVNDKEREGQDCLNVIRELRVWSRINHDNIVPLLGLWEDFEGDCETRFPSIVSTWMEDGDLQTYIQEHKGISMKEKLSYVGMQKSLTAYSNPTVHNHEWRIIHGDVKANNVLLRDGRAYLNDFGASRMLYDLQIFDLVDRNPGNWRWKAPELLLSDDRRYSKPTRESDIYSFGCFCLEVFTGQVPWNKVKDEVGLHKRLQDPVKIPARPRLVIQDDSHWFLLRNCWKECPTLRPLSKDIVTTTAGFIRTAEE